VVGDEDQSIYSWRGADIRNILDFEKDFPRAKVIRLEQNYRSTKNILEAASVVVANNKERKGKWLWTDADEGDMIALYTAHDAENEALYIADSTDKILKQYPGRRVAILYRTNSQSRQIEEALRRYNRKYNVVGGISYYQRAEVKDILAYLRLAQSQMDVISLQRIVNVPARGIGKTTVEQAEKFAGENGMGLWDAIAKMLEKNEFGTRAHSSVLAFKHLIEDLREAAQTLPLNETLAFIEERTGYRRMLEQENSPESQARLENLNELMNAAAEAVERGETASEFLDHAALVAQADALDEQAQITLMTIHNAKGLEFPVVFMAGMEDGLFPHSRSLLSEAAMEEERRLCYVGMTRAEKRLVMSWARYRRRFGGGEQERTLPSRFLKEVPENLVIRIGVEEDDTPQVDLTAERWQVRQDSRKNLYTGKTYNSVENVAQFFKERGVNIPVRQSAPPPSAPPKAAVSPPRAAAPPPRPTPPSPQRGLFQDSLVPPVQPKTVLPKVPAPARQQSRTGTVVEHPKYGTGTIVRREGEGDDAKIVVIFQRYGMKKLVEKYAGLRNA
jgi:ATP-dependent DNA helicase UvrD/PcrA